MNKFYQWLEDNGYDVNSYYIDNNHLDSLIKEIK